MAKNNMTFEEYREQVFEKLKEYANFENPDQEAQEYLRSDEVKETLDRKYNTGYSVEDCAWSIDMLY